jgi:hypothetical protein
VKLCMSCLWRGIHAPDCLDVTGSSSRTAVMERPEMPVEARTDVRRVSGWSLASLVVGSVLMALGWILNGPVSLLIYGALQRG